MRTLVLSILIAAIGAASLHAQASDKKFSREQEKAAEKAIVKELVELLHSYWTPKLNDYRRYIDRSISEPDLTQLNSLRLRFSFVMEEMKNMREARRAEYQSDRVELAPDSEVVEAELAPAAESSSPSNSSPIASPEIDGNPQSDLSPSSSEGQPLPLYELGDESAMVDVGAAVPEDNYATVVGTDEIPMGVEHDLSNTQDLDGVESDRDDYDRDTYVVPEREDTKIFTETKSLAARYGTMSDMLRRKVSEDMVEFLGQVVVVFERLSKEYPGLASAREDKDFQEMEDVSTRRVLVKGLLDATWRDVGPFIMLYNGGGLLQMLVGLGVDDIEGVDLSVASTDEESAASGRTLLMQNSPNPAATTTLISYRLAEPSAATRLKVYSANGEAMSDVDLGPQGRGDHETTLDVSGFAPGAYVYHLSAQSSMGEEVFSKMMQVVR